MAQEMAKRISSDDKSFSTNGSFSSPRPRLVEVEEPCTPKQNSIRHKALENLRKDSSSRSPLLQIPASPLMERLGYGTGVGVYTLNRSPRATVRSPWAIKKTTKVEEESEIYSARLEYEAEVLKKLSHPNIIGYRAFGKPSPDLTFLAMEKANKSLSDLIEDRVTEVMMIENCDAAAPFPANKIEKMAYDVAKALEYLHDHVKMIHGDLKSANVLVFGDFDLMKLCDFGVSRKIDAKGCVEGGYVGTEIWNPMEVIKYKKGKNETPVTYKADMYAFGLTIYEMISLKPPHLSEAEESMLDPEPSFNDSIDSSANDESIDVGNISFDENAYEEALARHIGTRPPLPDVEFNDTYNTILGIFFCCTEMDPAKRPDAKDIVGCLAAEPFEAKT